MVSLEEVAQKAIQVSLGVKTGENVWIHGWDHTIELMSLMAWECRKRGCHVILTVEPEDFWFRSIIEAPLELVNELSSYQASMLSETDAYVFTLGPKNPIPWEKIPQERHRAVSIWLDKRYDKSTFAKEWTTIARARKVRMLAIEATLATPERAEALGLNYEEWRDMMLEGCVADYHEIARRGKTIASMLSGKKEVRITTPHGTDLRFRLDNRPVDISGGIATQEGAEKGLVIFLPAGGVEITGDERSAEGTVVYDVPIRTKGGPVVGLALRVKDGDIVEFEATTGKEVFKRYLKEDGRNVNRFAFFGLGLNPLLRHGFTQDDKVLGGVIVGFGDNENKGGKNKANGHEWWASMTKATVTIGDTKIMQDGTLTI